MKAEVGGMGSKNETKLVGTVFGGVQFLDKYLQLRQADQILQARLSGNDCEICGRLAAT